MNTRHVTLRQFRYFIAVAEGGSVAAASRMLAIAQALQARGEAVAVATHGGPYTRVLDEAGMLALLSGTGA